MGLLEERVATLALKKFADLPTKSKPRVRPDGSREWVPMSAVVLARDADSLSEQLTCISLATGCKCLSRSLAKCHGQVLHDSHAEILALRGLNHFLVSQVYHILENQEDICNSPLVYSRSFQSGIFENLPVRKAQWRCPPFALHPSITIHLFSTEPPCGDSSMEILMSELGPGASAPWKAPPSASNSTLSEAGNPISTAQVQTSLLGRGFFSALGIVRRKPSRPDAEPTSSKSCTDKLSVKQIVSLLSFPTYAFIMPTANAYLSSLILSEATKYSETGCIRAFSASGRLGPIKHQPFPEGYKFHAFRVIPLARDFEPQFPFRKPPPAASQDGPQMKQPKDSRRPKASNLSALYIHSAHRPSHEAHKTTETLLNGVKQGYSLTSPDPRKASAISRTNMLQLGQKTARLLLEKHGTDLPAELTEELRALLRAQTYSDAKSSGHITAPPRQKAKETVRKILAGADGWVRNDGDEDWSTNFL